MNYAQLGLFALYALSLLVSGAGIYSILSKGNDAIRNRSIYLGEVLLLGSILLVGELLALSLIGMYKAPFLWGAVMLNCAFLFRKDSINKILGTFKPKSNFNLPTIVFIGLAIVLFFRNSYFMVDVDSISTYLSVQKLWLSNSSSVVGGIGNDVRIFLPHFDAVPYSLGISIFGQETFFPQLVNLLWRLIVLLLVFGYTSYRLNRYYGLAASMLVLFDGHFFYSGVNQWVVINGALTAFLFASAYNLWESKAQKSVFRFLLAVIFLSQLLANKYQMAYIVLFMLILGTLIQKEHIRDFKELFYNKRWLTAIIVSGFIMSLWYIKNMLVTGDPVCPIFADKFHVYNWTTPMADTFIKVFGGIKPALFLKYMNYFFIWPGINASKYVAIIISFLPLILVAMLVNSQKIEKKLIQELCYWLGLCVLITMGICLTSHQDPRYYRYPIGLFSFAAVFSIYHVLKYCFNIRKEVLLSGIIILLAFPAFRIIYQTGGSFRRPTFRENIDVLFNKIHMDYAIKKHYPQTLMILEALKQDEEKVKRAAWDAGGGVNLPFFLLIDRPVISLWLTTIIKWDSYNNESSIINDLKLHDIEWIMRVKDDKLIFMPIKDYAGEVVNWQRYPKKIYYDYGFPPELANISY